MSGLRLAFISSLLPAVLSMSATKTLPEFKDCDKIIFSTEEETSVESYDACNSVLPSSRDAAQEYDNNIASDYDCCYYWLDNNGAISSTWETTITEIVASVTEGKYLIKGLFADTFRPEGDKDFAVNDVEAAYEPATGVMSIECGQHLFDFKSGNYTYPISLLAIRKVSAGWNISAEGSMRLLRTERGFEVLADSDVIGFYLGMINPDTGGFSGFGGAIYPRFHEFNGVMLYTVAADVDEQMMAMLCNIYSYADDGKLHISNFANFGYHVNMSMDYDNAKGIAWAFDAKIDELQNLDGGMTPFYAANALNGGSDYGMPVVDGEGRFYFSANITKDNIGNTVLQIPLWGAYIQQNLVALYGSTNIVLFYPLPDNSSGIDEVMSGQDESESVAPVYYNLQGYPVADPVKGNLYVRVVGSRVDKVVY